MDIKEDISGEVTKLVELNSLYYHHIKNSLKIKDIKEKNEDIENFLKDAKDDKDIKLFITHGKILIYRKFNNIINYDIFRLDNKLAYNLHNVCIFKIQNISESEYFENLTITKLFLPNFFSHYGIYDSNLGKILIKEYINGSKSVQELPEKYSELILIQLVNAFNVYKTENFAPNTKISGIKFIELSEPAHIPIYSYEGEVIFIMGYLETNCVLIIDRYKGVINKKARNKNEKREILRFLKRYEILKAFSNDIKSDYTHNSFIIRMISSGKYSKYFCEIRPECVLSENNYFKTFSKGTKITTLSKTQKKSQLFENYALFEQKYNECKKIFVELDYILDQSSLSIDYELIKKDTNIFISFCEYFAKFSEKICKFNYNESNLYKNFAYFIFETEQIENISYILEIVLSLFYEIKDFLFENENLSDEIKLLLGSCMIFHDSLEIFYQRIIEII